MRVEGRLLIPLFLAHLRNGRRRHRGQQRQRIGVPRDSLSRFPLLRRSLPWARPWTRRALPCARVRMLAVYAIRTSASKREDYTDPLGRQLPYLATVAEGRQEQLRDLSSDAERWYVTGSQTVRADASVALPTDLVRGRDESFRAGCAARCPAHHFSSQIQQLDQSVSRWSNTRPLLPSPRPGPFRRPTQVWSRPSSPRADW